MLDFSAGTSRKRARLSTSSTQIACHGSLDLALIWFSPVVFSATNSHPVYFSQAPSGIRWTFWSCHLPPCPLYVGHSNISGMLFEYNLQIIYQMSSDSQLQCKACCLLRSLSKEELSFWVLAFGSLLAPLIQPLQYQKQWDTASYIVAYSQHLCF